MSTPANIGGITGLGSPLAPTTVGERQAGGRRGDPEAFRRALQQQSGQGGARQPAVPARPRPAAGAAMSSGLQADGGQGRNSPETAVRHIDVLA